MIFKRHYCVYIHQNLINNKRYIGQTGINPIQRWDYGNGYKTNVDFFNDIVKFGWDNFSHEIIKTNLTEEESILLEKELIQKYNSSKVEFGYNHSIGGKGLLGLHHSDESKRKISESHKGKKLTEKHKQKIGLSISGEKHPRSQQIYQCDLHGNVIKKWNCIKQAENDLKLSHGAISACCRGTQKTAFGYIWKYVS